MTTNKSHPRNPLRRLLLAALLAIALTSGSAMAKHAHAPAPGGSRTRITHVVVIWLKHRGSAAERDKLVTASKSFVSIPGVTEVTVGSVVGSQRPEVDSSFDVALVMGFKDKKSLDDYTNNPIHLRSVKEVLAPLAAKYVIYDFVNQ